MEEVLFISPSGKSNLIKSWWKCFDLLKKDTNIMFAFLIQMKLLPSYFNNAALGWITY